MTNATPNSADAASARRWTVFIVVLALAGLSWTVVDIEANPAPKLRHPAILDTAYFSFAFWCAAIALQLTTKRAEWRAGLGRFEVFRLTWSFGWMLFAVHVLVSFHFAHRWSHTNAIQHVQDVSGFGPGLFVSYAFTLIWLVDAVLGWVNPQWYTTRSFRFAAGLHGFMAFIVFHGTVVFGHGFMRWICAGAMLILLGTMLKNWQECKPLR